MPELTEEQRILEECKRLIDPEERQRKQDAMYVAELSGLRVECPSLYRQVTKQKHLSRYVEMVEGRPRQERRLPLWLGGALRFVISVTPAVVIAVGVPMLSVALGVNPRGFMATGFGPIVGFLLGLPSGMFAWAWIENDYDL